MATIVLRSVKGSPLTIAEADANFNNINAEVGTKLTATEFNASNILSLLSEYDTDGDGQGLNAATVLQYTPEVTAVEDSLVVRNQSGGIAATTFTGNLTGNVTGNLTGNVTGNCSGTAANVTNTVTIEHGGTGGTTATAARSNLGLGNVAVQNKNAIDITGGTIVGITDIAIADGGTGASTANGARINLGLVIGSDVQPFSNELTGIAGATSGTGFYVRTGAASVVQRSIAVGGNGLSISNGDGVSANPTISIATSASMTLAGLSLNSLTVAGTTTLSTLNAGTTSVGGLTSTSLSTGTIGCGAINASGQVYVTNNILATGNVVGYYSDDRLKTKLGRIEGALDKLCALEGFYFQANQIAQDLGYTDEKQVGVSAQSVQAVLPEVVGPAPIDPQYLTVDYARMVPLIIEAIKEIREELRSLK